MPGEKPGANSRGRGGKFRKFTRGGGKHFSRNLRPLDSDGNEISMWSEDAQKQFADENPEGEGSSEEDSEESDDDDAGQGNAASREERKKEKKARKEAAAAKKMNTAVEVGDMPPSDSEEEDSDDDDAPVNPNHSRAARSQASMTTPVDEAADGVKKLSLANRRERESLEALQAKERYRKLHEAGKTDEAKADLARLKVIREQREAKAARRQAEKEERETQEQARRAEIEAKEAKKRDAAIGPKKVKKATK